MADGYIPSYPEPRRTRALQLSNVAWNALAELALVKKLVEQLQGKISVASHSGQTTFCLELPQLRQPAQRPRTP